MKQIKRAGQSVRSGLSLMCIVCLLCGLLCGFFWLAGESPVLAAGLDGDALSARAVLSGDASLSAPERDEKLAVQAAAQATSPVVRTLAVGMDAADYTETVTCDYTPVYIDDSFGGYCYVIDGAAWLSADAFAEMLGLESTAVTDGDTQTVTVDGADITATYGAVSYTANGRCFYAPDGVYALDGKVVLPLIGTLFREVNPIPVKAAMGLIGVANSAGRLASGWIWVRFGFRVALAAAPMALIAAMALCIVADELASPAFIIGGFLLLGASYGGSVSAGSALTGSFFGMECYPMNYAVVSLYILVASLVGPAVTAASWDLSGSYLAAYVILALLALAALIIGRFLRPPRD